MRQTPKALLRHQCDLSQQHTKAQSCHSETNKLSGEIQATYGYDLDVEFPSRRMQFKQ
jgi:hypothetical protein